MALLRYCHEIIQKIHVLKIKIQQDVYPYVQMFHVGLALSSAVQIMQLSHAWITWRWLRYKLFAWSNSGGGYIRNGLSCFLSRRSACRPFSISTFRSWPNFFSFIFSMKMKITAIPWCVSKPDVRTFGFAYIFSARRTIVSFWWSLISCLRCLMEWGPLCPRLFSPSRNYVVCELAKNKCLGISSR